uniref:VIN3-like protein 3 n=2 Tax=Noccaea caerulescens TaxID=107243 RepID=A0A1J3DKY8_NOCCA
MDSSPGGSSMERSKMSVAEKRQLVHDLSKDLESASKALQDWTFKEIVEILSAETGRETKYKSKAKIINILLKTVREKKDLSPTDENSGEREDKKRVSSSSTMINSKRRRKNANPSRYVARTSLNDSANTKGKDTIYCKNLACRAILRLEDLFCKRCSCCVCYIFDDNKDPSLWLTCNSDPPFAGESCGFSCHLDCAFKNEKSGLKEDKPSSDDVDGCFYCVSCGKTNSLLECWKKQLTIAEETRSVDVLCRRLHLAKKLLKGTKKYRQVSEAVEEAVKSLQTEPCGPLKGNVNRFTDLPSAMRRGNVNRLQNAQKVKNLCSSALKSLQDTPLHDLLALPSKMKGSTKIIFEDVHATSLTLILGSQEESSSPGNVIHHSIWHRKVSEKDYPKDLTCALVSPNTRFVVSGLSPETEYCFKVVSFSGTRESSVDETKVSTRKTHQEEEEKEATLSTEAEEKHHQDKPEKKKAVNGEKSASCGSFGLEQCVNIIRQLEGSGYVDKNFRQKFLTWYSLRATAQETNVVKTFVDIFKDDSVALAEQLVDTFSDCISRKRSANANGGGGGGSGASAGFCMKPRH